VINVATKRLKCANCGHWAPLIVTSAIRSLLTLPKALVADHLTIIIIEVLLPNVDIEKFTNSYQAVTSMWLVPLINAYIATYMQLLPICPIRAERGHLG
jgi:hypothetical protein